MKTLVKVVLPSALALHGAAAIACVPLSSIRVNIGTAKVPLINEGGSELLLNLCSSEQSTRSVLASAKSGGTAKAIWIPRGECRLLHGSDPFIWGVPTGSGVVSYCVVSK